MNEVDKNAKIIWDYMLLHQELEHADAIFGLGSNDTRVAERAAELYRQGYAPIVIFSGKSGKVSALDKPEADVFAEVAIAHGVPDEKIIREDQATNTGENVLFTRKLLEEKGIDCKSFILLQKPYMERRTYATFRKQWPEAECVVTSPQLSFEEYIDPSHFSDKDHVINGMVGDLLRIKEYPAQGFQVPQEIPPVVWEAYQKLVTLGYTKRA